MEELSSTHRYAAGALLALALRQVQIYQVCPPGFNFSSDHESDESHLDSLGISENELWTNRKFGLLRPVFRYLKIEESAWNGLEETASSSPFKHHVGAFLRLLSEGENDGKQSSSENSNSETELAKAVNAMATELQLVSIPSKEDKNTNKETATNAASTAKNSVYPEMGEEILTEQRKMATLFELLAACVADTPEDDKKKSRVKKGYDARHRASLRLIASWFNIKWMQVAAMEVMVACSAMATLKEKEAVAEESDAEKSKWAKWKRGGIIGAAALTGGALLAITGGLAAPAIAAGLGALAPTLGTLMPVIGATGFAAAAAAAGSVAGSVAVAASFGAAGAGLSGTKMARRTGGIEEFEFLPIGENHQQGRLAVGIMISGFIVEAEDFIKPWEGKDRDLERYSLVWESKILMAVSTAIQDWLTSNLASELMKRGAMLTVLSTLVAALTLPSALLSATSFIDGKWSMAVDRSNKAGLLLAQVLSRGLHGNRPVTLIGFSLGARVIFQCLEELYKKGESANIVESVVLLGAPVTLDYEQWKIARRMVAGRFINCYSTNDWILGIIYRASLLTDGLAGIQAVELNGIENIDVTEKIDGHSSYLAATSGIIEELDLDSFYATSGKFYSYQDQAMLKIY